MDLRLSFSLGSSDDSNDLCVASNCQPTPPLLALPHNSFHATHTFLMHIMFVISVVLQGTDVQRTTSETLGIVKLLLNRRADINTQDKVSC